jgi:hypothetical protein
MYIPPGDDERYDIAARRDRETEIRIGHWVVGLLSFFLFAGVGRLVLFIPDFGFSFFFSSLAL